ERAYHQAYLIQVIETLETEELNSAERRLYRPMWNRLLPPLETTAGNSRRSITNRLDRYRLVLLPEPGTVVSTFNNACRNAESIQESLSPEAWATLSELRSRFERTKYRAEISDHECARVTRKLSDAATRLIPQFFAVATGSMLADDGWRFCAIGQMLERGIITANSVVSISKSIVNEESKPDPESSSEIELSAFLRLLGTRDAYRRVYQMRAEPIQVLEILWQNSQAPRSVLRCLQRCARLLHEASPSDTLGTARAITAIEKLVQKIKRINWSLYLRALEDDETPGGETADVAKGSRIGDLVPLLKELLDETMHVHHLVSDAFLSHQAQISQSIQPLLNI
ncbi:MAG TPA: alpha-E domain-containing protein, partial [Chthoniobacteraceae bacterium]|nr:alpha-E domain-containing protein [Chthoniobacteraceae bacterium]